MLCRVLCVLLLSVAVVCHLCCLCCVIFVIYLLCLFVIFVIFYSLLSLFGEQDSYNDRSKRLQQCGPLLREVFIKHIYPGTPGVRAAICRYMGMQTWREVQKMLSMADVRSLQSWVRLCMCVYYSLGSHECHMVGLQATNYVNSCCRGPARIAIQTQAHLEFAHIVRANRGVVPSLVGNPIGTLR